MSSSCLTVVGDVMHMHKNLLASSIAALIAVFVVAGVMQTRDEATRDPREKRFESATSMPVLTTSLRRPGSDLDPRRLPSFVVPEHHGTSPPPRHSVLIDIVARESIAHVTLLLPRSSRGPPAAG